MKTKTTKQRPAAHKNKFAATTAAAAAKRPQHLWLQKLDRQLPPLSAAATPAGPPRLLDKAQVCNIAGASYPTLWSWMRKRQFPRSRAVGGRSMWLSSEIEEWLKALPLRPLKGDTHSEAAE